MIKKTGKTLVCLQCKSSFYASGWQLRDGAKYCSPNCYHKSTIGKSMHPNTKLALSKITIWNKGLKGYMSGNKHWNWKGGIQSSNTRIRRSMEYKNWVFSIFKRDSFTCQDCKQKESVSGRLVADHVLPFSKFVKYRFDVNNGRTLCIDCHKKKTAQDWVLHQIKKGEGNGWLTNGN